ncbi:MAG: hypothetical protein WCF17_05325 [Terracidiphilus sp.]
MDRLGPGADPALLPWELPGVPATAWVGGQERRGFLGACANPACATAWLQIWRSRSAPFFEGGWNCSPACTAQRLESAVARELEGRGAPLERHRQRVPLGLLMLEQGWITGAQLRSALEGQRTHRAGRLGHWLMAKEGVSESLVTRALGLQWSCPVLPLEAHDAEAMAPALPRLFVDAFGALPLRVAAGRLLYMGFEDRPDPVLALAVERMTGLRVESGLVEGSRFRAAHQRLLEARFPGVELAEAASEAALGRALGRAVERTRPLESRLVRVHDCLWLRMWRKPQMGPIAEASSVVDMIATLAG